MQHWLLLQGSSKGKSKKKAKGSKGGAGGVGASTVSSGVKLVNVSFGNFVPSMLQPFCLDTHSSDDSAAYFCVWQAGEKVFDCWTVAARLHTLSRISKS